MLETENCSIICLKLNSKYNFPKFTLLLSFMEDNIVHQFDSTLSRVCVGWSIPLLEFTQSVVCFAQLAFNATLVDNYYSREVQCRDCKNLVLDLECHNRRIIVENPMKKWQSVSSKGRLTYIHVPASLVKR